MRQLCEAADFMDAWLGLATRFCVMTSASPYLRMLLYASLAAMPVWALTASKFCLEPSDSLCD